VTAEKDDCRQDQYRERTDASGAPEIEGMRSVSPIDYFVE
jgi:hypothetical protein